MELLTCRWSTFPGTDFLLFLLVFSRCIRIWGEISFPRSQKITIYAIQVPLPPTKPFREPSRRAFGRKKTPLDSLLGQQWQDWVPWWEEVVQSQVKNCLIFVWIPSGSRFNPWLVVASNLLGNNCLAMHFYRFPEALLISSAEGNLPRTATKIWQQASLQNFTLERSCKWCSPLIANCTFR